MKGAIIIHCERHLGGYIRAISNAMTQNMQQNSEQLGLTSTQGMFLHHLWIRKEKLGLPTYAKDLEEFFDIKHPTVSGVLQRMEAAGFVVKTTEVLAIPVKNAPGGLAQLLDTLKDCQVEYMYAFATEVHNNAVMVFRFADPDKALEALKAAHSDIIREAELYTLA